MHIVTFNELFLRRRVNNNCQLSRHIENNALARKDNLGAQLTAAIDNNYVKNKSFDAYIYIPILMK